MSDSIKNCFWHACPRRLDYFPESSCPLGLASIENKDVPHKGCPWFINSEVDHYCFWTWVRRVSDKEGFMAPLLQHEMSELLNQSSAKIHITFKEAVAKMQELPEFQDLKEMFEAD